MTYYTRIGKGRYSKRDSKPNYRVLFGNFRLAKTRLENANKSVIDVANYVKKLARSGGTEEQHAKVLKIAIALEQFAETIKKADNNLYNSMR